MVPWAHASPQTNRHLCRFSYFCRTHYCDTQTKRPPDHATRSVTTGRIYVRKTAMRPNKKIIIIITGDQSIFTKKGPIAAAHGHFNGIRQVAPVCTPVCFLGPTRVHTPAQTSSRSVQHFCTAHGRVSSAMFGHFLSPKNCAFACGDLHPRLIHGSLGPPESMSVDSFAHYTNIARF